MRGVRLQVTLHDEPHSARLYVVSTFRWTKQLRGSATLNRMRIATLIVCLAALAGCDEKTPTGPTVPLDQRVTLARGETGVLEGSTVRVQFVAVTSDSRCPGDAVCIQAGEAVVQFRTIDAGAAADYELRTEPSRASATQRGLRITLVELQPYPFVSKPIQPDDYRATVVVTRP